MKKFLTLFCVACLLSTAAFSQRKGHDGVSAQATIAIPFGNLSDFASIGFGVGGTYLHPLQPDMTLEGHLGYTYFSSKETGGASSSAIPILAGLRYKVGTNGMYLGGEAGLYMMTVSVATIIGTYSSSSTNFGLAPMVGFTTMAGNTQLDFSAKINLVLNSGGYDYITLNGGIIFDI